MYKESDIIKALANLNRLDFVLGENIVPSSHKLEEPAVISLVLK